MRGLPSYSLGEPAELPIREAVLLKQGKSSRKEQKWKTPPLPSLSICPSAAKLQGRTTNPACLSVSPVKQKYASPSPRNAKRYALSQPAAKTLGGGSSTSPFKLSKFPSRARIYDTAFFIPLTPRSKKIHLTTIPRSLHSG